MCPTCACRLSLQVSDFDILRRLGDGSFSTVVLARHRANGEQYAVKIINKTLVVRNKVQQNDATQNSCSAHQP